MEKSLNLSCNAEISSKEGQDLSWVLVRNAGHPWDRRTGFDMLEFKANSKALFDHFVAQAAQRYWHPWLIGSLVDGMFGGVLYKPSGIRTEWDDNPGNPYKPSGESADGSR